MPPPAGPERQGQHAADLADPLPANRRDAVYELTDLDRFIDERLKPRPGAARVPRPISPHMFEERRRLLTGNVGPDEARLRSFEFVVNAYRAHFGVDLEAAKQAVTAAVAARAKLKENA